MYSDGYISDDSQMTVDSEQSIIVFEPESSWIKARIPGIGCHPLQFGTHTTSDILAFVARFNNYLTRLEIQSDLKYFFQATGFIQYFPYACYVSSFLTYLIK
jgi:hypothetical protein